MEYKKYLALLQDEIGAAVFSTVDKDGLPQSRYINVGVGNENGIFFMTSPKTDFYQQLEGTSSVSMTGMAKSEEGIEVVRISGSVRKIGKEHLEEMLKDIYEKRVELLRSKGINITYEELLSYYK